MLLDRTDRQQLPGCVQRQGGLIRVYGAHLRQACCASRLLTRPRVKVARVVDGRVYHQGSPTIWWSYDLAARKIAVSEYQFRAPPEWFAESYAAYYQKRLPSSHPLYDWLEAERPKKNS